MARFGKDDKAPHTGRTIITFCPLASLKPAKMVPLYFRQLVEKLGLSLAQVLKRSTLRKMLGERRRRTHALLFGQVLTDGYRIHVTAIPKSQINRVRSACACHSAGLFWWFVCRTVCVCVCVIELPTKPLAEQEQSRHRHLRRRGQAPAGLRLALAARQERATGGLAQQGRHVPPQRSAGDAAGPDGSRHTPLWFHPQAR